MRILTVIIALLLSALTLDAQSTTKLWVAEKLDLSLSPKFTLKWEFAQRFENRNTDLNLPSAGAIDEWEETFAEMGVDYKINKNFVANISYRYINSKINTIKQDIENRVFIAMEYKFNIGIVSGGLRTRFATRFFDTGVKYRATETFRFSIPLPLKINEQNISYFFYDELHIDLNKGGFNNNEIRTGFNIPILKNMGVSLYYGNEYRKPQNGKKNICNIIGFEIGFKI